MKIKVKKQTMINGLQNVQAIVSSKSTLPILSNVMLEAADDCLKINATDLDVNVQIIVDANVSEEGSTTIDAKRLFSIFREISGDEVEMEVDNNQTSLRSGSSFFRLNGMSSEEFPQMPEVEDQKSYAIKSAIFKEMLQKTNYA